MIRSRSGNAVRRVDEEIPWKTVFYAVGLLITGLVLFIVGLTLWQTEGTSAFIGLFVLGLLVFIPGFHFTRLSWLAYTGRGSWKDLPDMPMSVQDEY